MKILKIVITSLCLLPSLFVWAEGPANRKASILAPDTVLFHPDSYRDESVTSHGLSDDLAKYGIGTSLGQRLGWGILVGFNETSNSFSGTQTPSLLSNPEFGPVIGGTLTAPFGGVVGARIELLYSQYAFSTQAEVGESPYSYINRLSYIDIPLTLTLTPIRKFSLFVGGNFSYLLESNYRYVQNPISMAAVQTCQNNNPHNIILGCVFGVEYALYDVNLSLRITTGVPDNNNFNPQNAVIAQFSFGYVFQNEE